MSTQHRIWVLKLVANVNRTAKAPKGASSSCAWTAVTLIKAQFIQQLRQDTAGSRTRQKEPLPHPRSGHLSDSEQSLRHFPTFQEEFSHCPRGGLREHLQIQRETAADKKQYFSGSTPSVLCRPSADYQGGTMQCCEHTAEYGDSAQTAVSCRTGQPHNFIFSAVNQTQGRSR